MTIGWPFKELLEARIEDVEASVVTCGTCPFNMQCAVSVGGTGIRMDCCGATGVEHGGLVYVLDCQRNTFERSQRSDDLLRCPLCSGDIIKEALSQPAIDSYYVPTAYAKVPVRVRIKTFKDVLPEAVRLKADVARVTET
jgi:hypothetical protein